MRVSNWGLEREREEERECRRNGEEDGFSGQRRGRNP